MPATAPVSGNTIGHVRAFLLDHERLLIVLVAAVVIWLGYVKVTNIIEEHDKAALQQAQIVAAQQATENAALAKQAQADAAQLQALSARLEAQNQQLANANTALVSALANQKKTDATLPPTELAQRWASITPDMPAGGVTLSPDNTMKVTQAGAVATVQRLEEVPALKQQLDNETQQKNNGDQLIAQQGKSIFDLNAQVGGLQKQITANDNVCKEEIKVVKDEARKSKRKWFLIGFVSGFVSRQFLGKGL
jgi:uncharacterized protein HemX